MAKVLGIGKDMTPIEPEEENLRLLGGEEHIVNIRKGIWKGRIWWLRPGP